MACHRRRPGPFQPESPTRSRQESGERPWYVVSCRVHPARLHHLGKSHYPSGAHLDRSQPPAPADRDWVESCKSVSENGKVAHEHLLLFSNLLRMVFHYDESDEKRLWKPKRERGGPACRASKFNPSTGKFDWRPSNHNLPHWAHPPLDTETETSPEDIWKKFSVRIAPLELCIVAHPDVNLAPPAQTLSSLTGQVQNLSFYRTNTTRCTLYSVAWQRYTISIASHVHYPMQRLCKSPFYAINLPSQKRDGPRPCCISSTWRSFD